MQTHLSVKAKRMPRQYFGAVFDAEGSIVSKATELISEAKGQAERLRLLISNEDTRLNKKIQTMSDEQLRKFIDVKMVEQSAEAMVDVMQTASQIKRKFEDLEPWLISFVDTAVRKIIGSFEADDLVSRLVREGMAEMDTRHTIFLRVHPEIYDDAVKAMETYPEHFNGIRKVTSDSGLRADQLFLEGSGGLVDVSLKTQLSVLLHELKQ